MDDLLAGRFLTEREVSEEMTAWTQAVEQTDKEKTTPKVVEVTTKEQLYVGKHGFSGTPGTISSTP